MCELTWEPSPLSPTLLLLSAQVLESDLADEAEWVTECMARLFIHSRLFQCARFYGDGIAALDKCPGMDQHTHSSIVDPAIEQSNSRKSDPASNGHE